MNSESVVDEPVEQSQEEKPQPELQEPTVKKPSIESIAGHEHDPDATRKIIACEMECTEIGSNRCDDTNESVSNYQNSENSAQNAKFSTSTGIPVLSASSCEVLQLNEDSRSSVQSVTSSRSHDPILKQGSLFSSISASNIIEYQWPADDNGEYYMIQEQISAYLGVTSFKRKYPGLTAVRSRDVCDMMMKEYPEKFDSYLTAQDEKRKENIRGKHQQYSTAAVEKSQLPNYMKKAMKQVSAYNARLNRRRRDDFAVYYDMQTNVLQFPKFKYKKLHPDLTRPSLYPCSLIPGQFQEYCQKYTSEELGYLPLNTAIYGPPPPPPMEISKLMQDSECSDGESIADETMETETIDNKADKTLEDEGKVENEEKEIEPNKGSGLPNNADPEVTEENSNSTDSIDTKDQNAATDKESEPASNDAFITKEELLQNYIDDPDKPMCGLCLRDETSNKKGEPEDLISCSQCDNYGHPSCLDMSKELISVIVTYNWQCLECKTCTYCNKPHHEDKMMFCDRCDRGYHTFCVGLRNLPSGLWMCPQCTRSDPDFAKKGGGRRRGPRKRKLSNDSLINPDEPPKPKRKRRTKKEMEEAREKERLEKEERLRKIERKAEKKERRRRRKLRKEQKAAEAAAAAVTTEGQQTSAKEDIEQDIDATDSKAQNETPSPADSHEPSTPERDDCIIPSKDDGDDDPNSIPSIDSDNTENQAIKDKPKPETNTADAEPKAEDSIPKAETTTKET